MFIKNSDLIEVVKFLTSYENITTLVIENLSDWDEKDGVEIDLPNLTQFKFDLGVTRIFEKIRSHKIEFMHVLSYLSYLCEKVQDFLGKFFQTCFDLKHLMLDGFYTDEILKIPSQLKTFEITKVYELPASFKKFLEIQKDLLENLLLNVNELDVDDETSNFIYSEMKLKKLFDLSLNHSKIFKLTGSTLKNLAIKISTKDFPIYEKLFTCLTSLETLSINLPYQKALEVLRLISTLPKLKNLCLYEKFSIEKFEVNFSFDRLERIKLSRFFDNKQLVKIICAAPNLTHIEINSREILKLTEFERIFETCPKIQEITFLAIIHMTEEDVETLKAVGLKLNIKLILWNEDDQEQLSELKNKVTVMVKSIKDSYKATPRILTDLFYDQNIKSEIRDYFYDYDDYHYCGGEGDCSD
jgi:hypothetical protein